MRAPSIISALLACATLASCAGEPETPRVDAEEAASAEEDTTTRRGSANASEPVCLQGGPFVADGRIPLASTTAGAAARIDTMRWETHNGCARFVVDFASEEGRPVATIGGVTAEFMRNLGVVRVELPDISGVDPGATDSRFDGLARAAYAVNSPDGTGMFVDLHLDAPAEAHVAVLENPARVAIDLRPGGPSLQPPAVAGRRVVVMEPRTGEESYPLTIQGYARTFEANVVARLEQDGRDADEMFTTATGWVDAWGHFSMTFDEGPTGDVVLHVGEYSARDGAWEGVAVDLSMR